MYKCCDIESLIQIYPHAVIHLFVLILRLLIHGLGFSSKLTGKTLLSLAAYMSGLALLEGKQTQKKISAELDVVSHDSLNRLASRMIPFCRQGSQCIVGLISLLSSEGWLIVDDLFIPKQYATWIMGAYYHFDHSQRRCLVGHRLVVVLWTNGRIRIPVAFALWHKREYSRKYRSKNQIARILIYWVRKQGVPFSYLTFDNWYASKQNLCFFRQLGISFVTRLRKNSWLRLGELKLTTEQLSQQHSMTKYHYYRDVNSYTRSFTVKYPRYGVGLLAVVKKDRHNEPGSTKFLFTNDITLTSRQVVLRYRSRWIIEQWFRDCKQHLGLSACQARELHQVLFHFRMVFLTAIISDLLKVDGTQSMGDVHQNWRSLYLLKVGESQPALIKIAASGRIHQTTFQQLLLPIRTKIQLPIENLNAPGDWIDTLAA